MNAYDNDDMDGDGRTTQKTRNADSDKQESVKPTGRQKELLSPPPKLKEPDDDDVMIENQEDSHHDGRKIENFAKKRKHFDDQEIKQPNEGDYIAVVGGEIIGGRTTQQQQPYGSMTTCGEDLLRHFTKRRFNRSSNNKPGLVDHSSSSASLPSSLQPPDADHLGQNVGDFAQSSPSIALKPRAGPRGNEEHCRNGAGDVATCPKTGNCDSRAIPSSAALSEINNNKHAAVSKSCNGTSDDNDTPSSSSSSSPSSTGDDNDGQFVVPNDDFVVAIEDGSGVGSQYIPTMIQQACLSPFLSFDSTVVPASTSRSSGRGRSGTATMDFRPGGGGGGGMGHGNTEQQRHDASGRRGDSSATTRPSAGKIQTREADEATATTARLSKKNRDQLTNGNELRRKHCDLKGGRQVKR